MVRKMVSVQKIEGVYPIENADRIEKVRIGGWIVVVGKDMGLKPGDHVAYFEIDSMLPADDPRYAELQKRGQRTVPVSNTITGEEKEITGHVLRTARLRGVYSQGLVMPLSTIGVPEDTPIGTDITLQADVWKYEELPPLKGGDMVGAFNAPCSKSDATRVQNLTAYWDEIRRIAWTPTVKVDGTSTTIYRDMDDTVHVYSRNCELKPECTNMQVAVKTGLVDALEKGMVCQFELCGPSINGNRLKLASYRPFVFAVWRDNMKLDRRDWLKAMLDNAVPLLDETEWKPTGDVMDMIAKVDGLRGNVTRDLLDEGIVWHAKAGERLSDDLYNELGSNRCFKIINNKYLTKHGL